MKRLIFFITITLITLSCKKNEPSTTPNPSVSVQFKFDESQERLNNLGQPSVIEQGHGTQTPVFHEMGVHYIELSADKWTQLGKGTIIYEAEETNAGGAKAIDFDKSQKAGNNGEFARISIKDITPGTYNWIRVSVSYQNYDIRFNILDLPNGINLIDQSGTINSFIGYNTFIREIKPRTKVLTVNGNRPQGFWAFETNLQDAYAQYNNVYFGQAPAGATTVVNPLFDSSPVPQGSCVITGQLAEPLVITGEEQDDIVLNLSFSVNKSLEWLDDNGNGALDFYGNPLKPHEKIVDMGIRGLKASFNK